MRDPLTNLLRANLRLCVDGEPTTRFSYDPAADKLSHKPRTNLPVGGHSVRVVATDAAGNRAERSWSFRVVRQ